jgi:anti-anti-sigma factor
VADTDHLRIDVRRQGETVVLELHGELDLQSAQSLHGAYEDVQEAGAVILDIEQLEFLDSAGLRTILSLREHAQEHGRELAITRGSQQVQRLLTIAGVGAHLRIVASSDELPV